MRRKPDPKESTIGPPPNWDIATANAAWRTHEFFPTCRWCGKSESGDFANWPCGDEEVRAAVREKYGEGVARLIGLTADEAAELEDLE